MLLRFILSASSVSFYSARYAVGQNQEKIAKFEAAMHNYCNFIPKSVKSVTNLEEFRQKLAKNIAKILEKNIDFFELL